MPALEERLGGTGGLETKLVLEDLGVSKNLGVPVGCTSIAQIILGDPDFWKQPISGTGLSRWEGG